MNPTVVVMGIPESGKSSFIAALSHILEFKEIDTVLTLDHLSDEDRYLFEMRSEWQSCKPFGRTKAGIHPITFWLRDKEDRLSELAFPDIAGEEFEQHWSARVWNEEYLRAVEGASGVLLFVNAKTLKKPFSLADADKVKRSVLAMLGEDDTAGGGSEEQGNEILNAGEAIAKQVSSQTGSETETLNGSPMIWDPRKADEQAKLVDVLQSIADFDSNRRWRLGVIISAWDLVQKVNKNEMPRAWLDKHMPLVSQYLFCNPDAFHFEVFGVSAQGGDPDKESKELQALDAQSKRVQVVSSDYEGHDLTRVVAWVTGP